MAFECTLTNFTWTTGTGAMTIAHGHGVTPTGIILLSTGYTPSSSTEGGLMLGFAANDQNTNEGCVTTDEDPLTTTDAGRLISNNRCAVIVNGNTAEIDGYMSVTSMDSTNVVFNRIVGLDINHPVGMLSISGCDVSVGSFLGHNSTANQNVSHGLGSTPKAMLLLRAGGVTSFGGFNESAGFMFGMVDQDFRNKHVSLFSQEDASDDGYVAWEPTYSMGGPDTTGAWSGRGRITSWGSTNFTINWLEANGSAYCFMAIGGANLISEIDTFQQTGGTVTRTPSNNIDVKFAMHHTAFKTSNSSAISNADECICIGLGDPKTSGGSEYCAYFNMDINNATASNGENSVLFGRKIINGTTSLNLDLLTKTATNNYRVSGGGGSSYMNVLVLGEAGEVIKDFGTDSNNSGDHTDTWTKSVTVDTKDFGTDSNDSADHTDTWSKSVTLDTKDFGTDTYDSADGQDTWDLLRKLFYTDTYDSADGTDTWAKLVTQQGKDFGTDTYDSADGTDTWTKQVTTDVKVFTTDTYDSADGNDTFAITEVTHYITDSWDSVDGLEAYSILIKEIKAKLKKVRVVTTAEWDDT